jgi:hypothetical protein
MRRPAERASLIGLGTAGLALESEALKLGIGDQLRYRANGNIFGCFGGVSSARYCAVANANTKPEMLGGCQLARHARAV